jgi:hypothetical protein
MTAAAPARSLRDSYSLNCPADCDVTNPVSGAIFPSPCVQALTMRAGCIVVPPACTSIASVASASLFPFSDAERVAREGGSWVSSGVSGMSK